MPDKSPEERLATLEAQVQGIADEIVKIYGWRPGYSMSWSLLGDDPEPQWLQLYNWRDDPTHPLHEKTGGGSA